ncbi:hypothetical protein ACWEQL_03720 [Kitasatospora sp. NPDC004240]
MGDVGDLGGVGAGQADPEVHGKGGQREGEAADDDQEQGEGATPEAAPVGVVQLTELGDRRGRCLDARGKRHRDREGEDDRQHGGTSRVGVGGRGSHAVRGGEAEDHHGDGGKDDHHGHRGEQQPAAVTEPDRRNTLAP